MENLSESTKSNNANTLLGAVLVYFVEYDWVGYKRHCQMGGIIHFRMKYTQIIMIYATKILAFQLIMN